METRDEEQRSSNSSEERAGPEQGPGVTPASTQATDADGATAADAAMPTLPPRVEPGPRPAPGPFTRGARSGPSPLDQVDEDDSCQLRPVGDVGRLATDLARLGQLFPVDVRPLPGTDRFQLVSGFRRVARSVSSSRDLGARAGARDAVGRGRAAGGARRRSIHAAASTSEELDEVEARLEQEGRLSPAARDMLEKALGPRTTGSLPNRWKARRRSTPTSSPPTLTAAPRRAQPGPVAARRRVRRARARPAGRAAPAAALRCRAGGVPRPGGVLTPWRWTGTVRGCSSC